MGENEGSDAMSAEGIKMRQAFSLEPEERSILEDIVSDADLGTDQRVLAWAKLKSWGHGREFACCHVRDLKRDRADVTVLPCWTKERIPAILDELVVASQQQCADELDVPLDRVRAAASRLVKRGFLTTPWVASRSFVTKYKLGKGFQAHLATKQVRAFCPAREVE
jgi:hypothetical protein